jgi:hypothetical protein
MADEKDTLPSGYVLNQGGGIPVFTKLSKAGDNLPAGYTINQMRDAPAEKAAPTVKATIGPPLHTLAPGYPKALPTRFDEPGPIRDYLEAGANLTQEGRKEHPIRAAVGDTMKRVEDFGSLLGTMGVLLGGPEGKAAAPELLKTVEMPAAAPKPIPFVQPKIHASSIARPLETTFPEPINQAPVQLKPLEPKLPEPINQAPVQHRLPTLFEKGTRPAASMPQLIEQAAGVKPLKPDVPLREQLSPQPTKVGEVVDPIKAKYPDPAVRQMVRANGERMYEAAKENPETVKAIHDLTRVDLREALINSGEDMGQTTVSNSKFAGKGSITREDAFNRLLDKGLAPDKILELAKKPAQETAKQKMSPKQILEIAKQSSSLFPKSQEGKSGVP